MILVTGAAGLTGGETVRRLAARGLVRPHQVQPAEALLFENWNTPHEAGLKSGDPP